MPEPLTIGSMIHITTIAKTCNAMPSQWEGMTSDGRAIYIRYRHGMLTVQLSAPNGTMDDAIDSEPLLTEHHGDSGEMTDQSMHEHTRHIIAWPEWDTA